MVLITLGVGARWVMRQQFSGLSHSSHSHLFDLCLHFFVAVTGGVKIFIGSLSNSDTVALLFVVLLFLSSLEISSASTPELLLANDKL